MYAIAFDLVVRDTERHHPKGVSQAYADIGAFCIRLVLHGFRAACMSPKMKTWPICFWQ